MDIKDKDALENFMEGDYIVLRKCEPGCVFCGGVVNVREFQGKMVCSTSREELGRFMWRRGKTMNPSYVRGGRDGRAVGIVGRTADQRV